MLIFFIKTWTSEILFIKLKRQIYCQRLLLLRTSRHACTRTSMSNFLGLYCGWILQTTVLLYRYSSNPWESGINSLYSTLDILPLFQPRSRSWPCYCVLQPDTAFSDHIYIFWRRFKIKFYYKNIIGKK